MPLQINNLETGYHIKFVLDQFIHDYNTDTTSWIGQYLFDEIQPDNDKQKMKWEANRKKVWNISITKFIKSLYHEALLENGFLLTCFGDPHPYNNNMRDLRLIDPGIFLSIDPIDSCKNLYIPPNFYDILLVCFGKTVSHRDLGSIMFAQNGKCDWSNIGSSRNVLRTPERSVRIFQDGTFMNTLFFNPTRFSKSLTGLDMTLPLECNFDIESKADVSIEHGFYLDREKEIRRLLNK